MTSLSETTEIVAAEEARRRDRGEGLGPSDPDRVKRHLDVALDARKMPGGPPTDDERLCADLELEAHLLNKHYNRKSAARALLLMKAAKRIRELTA